MEVWFAQALRIAGDTMHPDLHFAATRAAKLLNHALSSARYHLKHLVLHDCGLSDGLAAGIVAAAGRR